MRSSGVSTVPYIMVAVVDMPARWAALITSSHSSLVVLRGAITWRTRSTRISAPPPGSESWPTARRRVSVSSREILETWLMWRISEGDSACRWIG